MYTNKQAQEALSLKFHKDFEKRMSLMWHEVTIRDMGSYNLPYRILFNYYKNSVDRDFMEVPINLYYPYPTIPKEYKPPKWNPVSDGGYSMEEWIGLICKHTGEVTEDGKEKVTFEVPAEIQAQIDEWEAQKVKERTGQAYKHIWDLSTAAGREQWLYWFAVFILPYADDIPHFSTFDMFGDTKHTKQELEERKRYYMGLIEQCQANPEIYKHEVQRKDITDYEKYDFEHEYMWRDDLSHEPPQTDNALQIMYYERERLKRYYGKDYEWQAKYERYGQAYKVEEIIQRLEAEQGIKTD